MPKKKPFLVCLRPNQIEKLKSITDQEQKHIAEMIREAIDQYLENK